jgi:hypothetical protein
MQNLFDQSDVSGIIARIEKLVPTAQRQWGKMNAAQMLAHCNMSLQTAMGEHKIPRTFIGRILGPVFKPMALGKKPFGKNSPTDKSYIFPDDRIFNDEKSRVISSVKKFSEGGPSKCTTYPHPFFGSMKPEQWAVFEWKHLDHHLRQFGL